MKFSLPLSRGAGALQVMRVYPHTHKQTNTHMHTPHAKADKEKAMKSPSLPPPNPSKSMTVVFFLAGWAKDGRPVMLIQVCWLSEHRF